MQKFRIALAVMAVAAAVGCAGQGGEDEAAATATTVEAEDETTTTEVEETTSTEEPTTTTAEPTTTITAAPTTTTTEASTDPVVLCTRQPPATEEIIAWYSDPEDQPPFAQQLGGNWVWDFAREECITSTELVIRGHPPIDGYCTLVAPVSANLGYDDNQRPAPRPNGVVAFAGDC